MNFLAFPLVILSIIFIRTIWARKSSRLPPGPYPLPIIGNYLQLGPKPHQSLARLSRKYGPLMSLKLGSMTTIVVSSPEIAEIVVQKKITAFSSRLVPSSLQHVDHDKFSIGWSPMETQWRKLRRICQEQLFSPSRLASGRALRREKLDQMRDHVRECGETGRAVDIGEAVFATSLNLISAALFSTEFDLGSAQELKDVVRSVMKCLGVSNVADYFPILRPLDPQGIVRENKMCFEKLFGIFDGIIDERLKSRVEKKDDFVEALIDIHQRDDAELTRNDINHLLLDLFTAGTDTTSGTVEWAMTELLRNPDKIDRVRNEIRAIIKENGQIEEEDIQRLPYLQAVVKETFRLHPTAPFLIPHKAVSNVEINGYEVPKNAQIIVNVWALGRDPTIWPEADRFVPERFLNRETDYRGKHFELIPFGAGRRICPGLPLAHRMVHLMLATLIGEFEWRVEDDDGKIDVDDKFGLTVLKAVPLKAVPFKI